AISSSHHGENGRCSGTGDSLGRSDTGADPRVIGRCRDPPERPFRARGAWPTIAPMTELDLSTSPYLAAALANDRAHVFHSWSAQGALQPTVIAGARGSRMWDDKGRSWLDFASQLVNVNIGHQHPKLVAAIHEQASRLCTIAPFMANDMRSEAARLITELAPGDRDMVFFTNGGTDAVENAVRLARGHTGRLK